MFSGLYYWILFYFRKVKTNTDPEFNAMAAVAMIQNVNFVTLVSAINCVLRIKIPKEQMLFFGFLCTLFIFLQNYFFIYKKRQKIIAYYDKLNNKSRMKGKWFLLIYIVLSCILFYLFGSCVATVLKK